MTIGDNTPKVILISQVSLPYFKIGSWTTLYHNYLNANSKIDIIICPKPDSLYANIDYNFVKFLFINKVLAKVLKRRKLDYLSALDVVLKQEDKYIIQLVDDYGLVKPLHDFLVRKGMRTDCYIQFFYHGFEPYLNANSNNEFYDILDEIVVLTHASYYAFKDKVSILPNHFSVLNNGIDTTKFHSISLVKKRELKDILGLNDKKVFLWCSQDRPKKGLNIILEAWKRLYAENSTLELLVVGSEPRVGINGVRFLGKLPNDELAKFYQAADCYLFSTLCHEGFGMSLIEALHCGCYCIASRLGGVPEVLGYGKFGKLIDKPHFVSEWIDAMREFTESDSAYPSISKELYSKDVWNLEMNNLIQIAQNRIS